MMSLNVAQDALVDLGGPRAIDGPFARLASWLRRPELSIRERQILVRLRVLRQDASAYLHC